MTYSEPDDGADHFHIMPASEAIDIDHDGLSDAVTHQMGGATMGSGLYADVGPSGEPFLTTMPTGPDSDHDGFSDGLEHLVGSDPYDPDSHPVIVEAHHFPAGSDHNLPGTHDISLDPGHHHDASFLLDSPDHHPDSVADADWHTGDADHLSDHSLFDIGDAS